MFLVSSQTVALALTFLLFVAGFGGKPANIVQFSCCTKYYTKIVQAVNALTKSHGNALSDKSVENEIIGRIMSLNLSHLKKLEHSYFLILNWSPHWVRLLGIAAKVLQVLQLFVIQHCILLLLLWFVCFHFATSPCQFSVLCTLKITKLCISFSVQC